MTDSVQKSTQGESAAVDLASAAQPAAPTAESTEVAAAIPAELPLALGARFRAARQAKGLSVADVAGRLKLSARQIDALEAEQFDALPTGPHLRGFVRNYARLVDQDADKMLGFLPAPKRVVQGELRVEKRLDAPFPHPTNTPVADRGWVVVALAVAVLAGGFGLYAYLGPSNGTSAPRASAMPATAPVPAVTPASVAPIKDAVTPLPPPSAPVPSTDTPSATTSNPALPAAPSADSEGAASIPIPTIQATVEFGNAATGVASGVANGVIQLSFATESWVEIKDATGTMIHNRLHKPGDTVGLEGKAPFDLTIGNSRAVKLTYKGQPVPLDPHTKVSVARLRLN
jgi:cytoskeleton protein RodZ